MKAAVIGISFYQRHLIQQLKEKGFYVIGIDGDSNPYGKDLVDEFLHIDVKDYDSILTQLKSKNIEGIFTVASDITLPVTSKISSALNLPGMSYDTYERFESKDKYYDLFDKINVSIPKTYKLEDVTSLSNKKYIVKPSQGAGNRGVEIINNIQNFDFESHQKKYYREGEIHLIQDYIVGQKHTLDGICYKNKFYPLAFSKSYNRENSSLSNEIHFSSFIEDKYKDKVTSYCDKIAKHITDNVITPLHMEFISNEDNIYLIDFSLRGGGYDIFTSLIYNITGYDVLTNYINSILGKEVELPINISDRYAVMDLIYSNKSGIIKWLTTPKLYQTKNSFFKRLAEDKRKVNYPERDGDRIAYTICYGGSLDEAKNLSKKIESKIKYKIT
jgi:predicted ATP-grasp superfamily ATP-dependent carboligase